MNIEVNNVPVPILLVKREAENIHLVAYANQACHALFGYDDSELIGKELSALVPIESRPLHTSKAEKYFTNTSWKPLGIGRDLRGLRKDGKEIPVEIGLYPFQDGVLVVLTDITIRQSLDIKQALIVLRDKLANIVERLG